MTITPEERGDIRTYPTAERCLSLLDALEAVERERDETATNLADERDAARAERDAALAEVERLCVFGSEPASKEWRALHAKLAATGHERDNFRDGMVAMLVAAGAPEDIDGMESVVSKAGSKPSDFVRMRIRVLTAERDAICKAHNEVIDERDAARAELAACKAKLAALTKHCIENTHNDDWGVPVIYGIRETMQSLGLWQEPAKEPTP